jgi:ethanolamine utilization cobalamin adenosyltransferase
MWLVAFEQRFDAENALATPSAKQLNGKQLTLDWYQPAATQQQQQQQKQGEGESEKGNEEEEGVSEVTDQ